MNSSYVRQETEYFCAPAVAQMVLTHFGERAAQSEIAAELKTSDLTGTRVEALQAFFSRRGLTASYKNHAEWNEIRDALGKGLVIVGYIEKGGDPHYALVTSVTTSTVVLNDPWHGEGYRVDKKDFIERWKDIEPPGYGDQMLMMVQKKEKKE